MVVYFTLIYIVMVNSNIFLQRNKSGFLFWFLSWANMDSGFPMCFYYGMTEPAKLGLQYLFPTYIIIMIAIISVLSRQSLAMQRILSQLDGLHMLATMLYISFLKLFRTVIDTLTFVSLVSENGEEEDVIWFFDGTLEASNPISVILILLVFHKGQSDSGSSKATTGTTAISLQDMVAAPDNEVPTLSQLREPVLDLVED